MFVFERCCKNTWYVVLFVLYLFNNLCVSQNSLSLWIQLNVPRIADNTSFSQDVQMQLLEQISSAESVGLDVLDQFAGYFLTRAELVTKILKYPGIEDYRNAVIELDEKTYIKVS